MTLLLLLLLLTATLNDAKGVWEPAPVRAMLGARACLHDAHVELFDALFVPMAHDTATLLVLQAQALDATGRALMLGRGLCAALDAGRAHAARHLTALARRARAGEAEARGWPATLALLVERAWQARCSALVLLSDTERALDDACAQLAHATRRRESCKRPPHPLRRAEAPPAYCALLEREAELAPRCAALARTPAHRRAQTGTLSAVAACVSRHRKHASAALFAGRMD